jgi:hypothetical protein
VATIDINETASLAIPCGGRAVVRIGIPTITSANLTFSVTPYPGATARLLKDSSGTAVTITAGTGNFTVDVPELAGAYAFTIISSASQGAARAFQVQCIGSSPELALTNTSLAISDQWTTVPKAFADISTGADSWTTGHSPITLFTVTGLVMVRVFGKVGAVQLTSTGGTGTAAIGVAGATGALIAATTANGTTNFVAGAVWVDTTPAVLAEAMPLNGGWFLCNSNIILTIATNSFTAGDPTLYCQYIPVSTDGAVVAA